jgi:hypothetical protein
MVSSIGMTSQWTSNPDTHERQGLPDDTPPVCRAQIGADTRTPSVIRRSLALALALLFLFSAVPVVSSADEIPHENYDLIGTNIDAIVALLNSSIGYSEYALTAMYYEAMGQVDENLSIVQGLLTPAELLLDKIRTVASSYENLSTLLPPFADLSPQMSSFGDMEVVLLNDRTGILSAAKVENLTGDALAQALLAIKSFNSLIIQMNRTIDDMLVSAYSILNLTVQDERPFADNQLIPLIERLRDLLRSIELEIEAIIHDEEYPWPDTESFLIIWLADTKYYLGDLMTGGGYLYYGGGFQSGRTVNLLIDGSYLTQAITNGDGKFSFSYDIPVNASWLGIHSISANATTPNGTLSSNSILITISLVPTRLTLTPNGVEFAIDEMFTADLLLTDYKGRAIGDASCTLELDSDEIALTTDTDGNCAHNISISELGYGTHSAQAFYQGVLPFASTSSNIAEFRVNIPTNISLTIFLNRIPQDWFLVGNGTLLANGSELMPGQEVTLSVDGVVVANLTTDAKGEFAFTISIQNMILGAHVLKAEFIHRDQIWRYSSSELGFTILGKKTSKYPFFPYLGKWGQSLGPGLTTPYLFIGPYAYIFWLLLLILIGLTVKAVQARRRKALEARSSKEKSIVDMTAVMAIAPPAAISEEEIALELQKDAEAPATPNERIVLYYNRLLSFLARRGNVSLRSSMTHWEVARLLKAIGYPTMPVENVTVLFERAFYSGTDLSDSDTVSMSSAITGLVSSRKSGVGHAVKA